MAWITLQLRVTTPVFNAGADQDHEAAVRVPTLRGAMRFWLRALVGCVVGSDLAKLASLEQRVFGSAEATSPVALRITNQQKVIHNNGKHDFLPNPAQAKNNPPERWIVYLLGQGLGDLATCALKRPYVPPGEEIILKLRFHHRPSDTSVERAAIRGVVLASLWLTCAYGGIGARVRRGFGGLRIIDATDEHGELPASWPVERLRSPDLAHYRELRSLDAADHLSSAIADIRTLVGGKPSDQETYQSAQTRPAFPVLDRAWTQAGLCATTWPTWNATLTWAGEQLRHFRACRTNTNPNAKYQPKIKTPEWETVIHSHGNNHYPLGALGLPVVYKDGYSVDAIDHRRKPGRRASPLWLRPVCERNTWGLFSFAFGNQFLPGPDAPTVTVRGPKPKQLHTADDDVDSLAAQWIQAHTEGKSFTDPSIHR